MPDPKARVLLVDDEEGIRELFKESLEEEGYQCFTAASGAEGLNALSTSQIDVIVLDIMMPQMSGLTFFENIKGIYPNVAVIFSSGIDEARMAVNNLKDGAFDYLVKPVSVKRLLQAIEEVLAKRDEILAEKQSAGQCGVDLNALNRMFQQHLNERVALVTAYREVVDGLQKLGQNAEALVKLAQSQPIPELQEPQRSPQKGSPPEAD